MQQHFNNAAVPTQLCNNAAVPMLLCNNAAVTTQLYSREAPNLYSRGAARKLCNREVLEEEEQDYSSVVEGKL